MSSGKLCCGPSTVTFGVRDMRVRVQVYMPELDVVRGERVRESLSVEISHLQSLQIHSLSM